MPTRESSEYLVTDSYTVVTRKQLLKLKRFGGPNGLMQSIMALHGRARFSDRASAKAHAVKLLDEAIADAEKKLAKLRRRRSKC